LSERKINVFRDFFLKCSFFLGEWLNILIKILNTDACIPDPYVFGTRTGVYFRKLAFEWFDFLET